MTRELSDKIKLISLVCTIMVVYRHAHTMEAFFGGDCAACHTYYFVAHGFTGMTSIAVPYFFLISGFFFLKRSYYGEGQYITMLKKKMRTLFVPFCIWNLLAIYPLWYSGKMVVEPHWYLYVLDFLHSDYNGPMWYVRTLMLFMLLSPLYDWIFLLDRKMGKKWELSLQIVILLYVFTIWWPMDSKTFSTEGILFFMLGGIIRKHEQWLDKLLPSKWAFVLFTLWIVSCFTIELDYWTSKIHLLFGVFAFWNVIRCGCKGWVASMAGYAFFIYVNHFILLKIIKSLLAPYFYGNEPMALATFLLSPWLVVLAMWKVGMLWNRFFPKSFAWVTGGRTA